MVPNRIKVVAATGLLLGALGVAALPQAFAAPLGATTATVSTAAPSAATATTPTPGTATEPAGGKAATGRGVFLASVAGFLGMQPADLHSQLASGQTLAQIATAHGKTTDELKAFLTSQLKTRLDAAVAAGKMTSQQEQDVLSRASTRIDQRINAKIGTSERAERHGKRGWLAPIASFLGMQPQDLVKAVQGGQTLGQVAQAHGKTPSDLKAFLLDRASNQIDRLLNANLQRNHVNRGGATAPSGTAAGPTATVTPTSG